MNGAIFFSSKYGSTAKYANWLGAATDLTVHDVSDSSADPSTYDFLVIGSPVYYYKLRIRKWLSKNLVKIQNKPIVLFTVSGAPAGPKLDRWIADSLPEELSSTIKHIALPGRQIPEGLTWWDRIMLKIGALMNSDPVARQQELKGFDFMDQRSIEPLIGLIRQMQLTATKVPVKSLQR